MDFFSYPMNFVQKNRRILGCILGIWCSTTVALAWPVDVLEDGPYAVACSNMEMHFPETLSMDVHLVGSTDYGDPVYINSLMMNPGETLNITIQVPLDYDLYGPYAGEPLSVVGYLVYPTDESNDRPDYVFPYLRVPNSTFPKMDRPGDEVIPVPGNLKFPLVVSSHGHESNGIWDLGHLKFLASHGYVALSIFHGDGRIYDYSAQYSLRTLMTKAFIDYILTHPKYGQLIDQTRIGVSGTSFGGYTGMALMGAKYNGHPDSVVDERIKATFAEVPWVGDNQGDLPFQLEFASLQAVTNPLLAVVGEIDTIALPELTLSALEKTSGPTIAFQFAGEGHGFSEPALKEAQTLEVLFFDAYLKGSSTARQILYGTTYVHGDPLDEKVLQRLPSDESEDENVSEEEPIIPVGG